MKPETARRMVRDAIKRGDLVRPHECNRCGSVPPKASDGRSQIHAHHHDYTKPLDIEWICAACHRKETPLPKVMGAPTPGSRNGQAKLTETCVLSARRLRQSGWTFQAIADRFDVNKATIIRACNGKQWLHVAVAPSADRQAEAKAELPAELFDGFTVYKALTKQAEQRTSYQNVSDVLDAIAKVMRAPSAPGRES